MGGLLISLLSIPMNLTTNSYYGKGGKGAGAN